LIPPGQVRTFGSASERADITALTETEWPEQTPTDPGVRVAAAASPWLGIPAADVGVLARELGP
jgi:hypothetical protein